ncbi:MAG: SMC-Scp complex subunit ScpB [Clostridia bacterium]|nr:SMC-Scp complex subunit ScpB [Clostridia bacterium]
MQDREISIVECILFVSGEPLTFAELMSGLDMTQLELQSLLQRMDALYREEKRGIQLYMTEQTVQLVSNREYAPVIENMLQPVQAKSFSQSMLETLSIIAYKQPVTRAEIEAVRGVRCDYSVSQLLNIGMIQEVGRKDTIGRPMMFGTTDAFLRQFGLHSLKDLPQFSPGDEEEPQLGATEVEGENFS